MRYRDVKKPQNTLGDPWLDVISQTFKYNFNIKIQQLFSKHTSCFYIKL